MNEKHFVHNDKINTVKFARETVRVVHRSKIPFTGVVTLLL